MPHDALHDAAPALPEAARRLLRRRFGHPDFRPHQAPVVDAVLGGGDVLAVLPTGAGKSVCFQVPALLARGLTLVVTPLVSLMEDQVAGLRRRGIAARTLHGGLAPATRRAVEAEVRAGRVRLLYAAPERLATARFGKLLTGVALSRLVVDEAHCVSEWGHDFRPAYRRIGRFRHRAGGPPVAAFTATATPATEADIVRSLELRRPAVFRLPVDRPNLRWAAAGPLPLPEVARRAGRAVRRAPGASVVYVSTRARAVRFAAYLRRCGLRCAPYHAGLSHGERRRIQAAFLARELPVVCATTAFGMGIDHPAVRLVCHVGIPGSLEGYVQAAGRGGRDGRPARCLLLAAEGDREVHADLRARSWPEPRHLDAVWWRLPARHPVSLGALRRSLGGRVPAADLAGALRVLALYGLLRTRTEETDGGTLLVRAPERLRDRLDPEVVRRGRERAARRVQQVYAYVGTPGCRRRAIARHFGEPPPGACSGCDRCGGGAEFLPADGSDKM